MEKKWKKYLKRFILVSASVFSFFTGGYIIYDLYLLGLNNVTPLTMTFLAVALIFIWMTLIVIVDDLYRVKK